MGNKERDLLKEAIADAKAIKETALANAKAALEEAFQPKLQSMLSAKIQREMEEEDEDLVDVEEPVEEQDDEENDDLDLESIIHELEDELEDEEEDEELEEPVEEQDDEELDIEIEDDEEEPVEEQDDEELDIEIEDDEEEPVEEQEEDDEVDLSDILEPVEEEDDEEEDVDQLKNDLGEAYKTIKIMRKKINEVNLLNAKLLFANKLFKNFELNEQRKVKVIETLDRAKSVREVKLVYATLAESYKAGLMKKKSPSQSVKSLTESLASKVVAGTKPKKQILTENDDIVDRFKKLAGIKPKK